MDDPGEHKGKAEYQIDPEVKRKFYLHERSHRGQEYRKDDF